LSGHKLNLATIDLDLKIREIKRYPLSANGRHIEVCNGGEGHFMPLISNTSYIEFPSWKRYYLFGERTHKRVYFAMNKAKKCIDFASGEVDLPSLELMKQAMATTMLGQIGKEKQDMTWRDWAVLILTLLTFLMVINMSGVLR
jgi:hypothetical protein